MKPNDLRKEKTEKLLEIKKNLELDLFKSKSNWSIDKTSNKDVQRQGTADHVKGYTAKGTNTSLTKDLRRNIARISTILKERENEKN